MRAHFRLVDAAEGEHGNVKAAEGKDRVFILAAGGTTGTDFLALEEGEQGQELVLRFEYRPATLTDWPEAARKGKTKPPAQKDLTSSAVDRVLAVDAAAFAPWIVALRSTLAPTEKDRTRTALAKHLDGYTARNTFDYFIHKDLGGFLRRELDFYIKNEVMHLDDIESQSVPRVEQYLSKIKVLRRIAGKIIDFLAQLEEFQKKLWLKKKFVVETSWCVRVGCIPEEFYAEIAANQAQCEEWVRLFAIDSLPDDLEKPRYSVPLTVEFLQAHPTLVVDTRHFTGDFTARLIEAMGEVDEQLDGVLVHSENFQALKLMQRRVAGKVGVIFADPPYNTGVDGFPYRDNYQHSTWLAMMEDRLSATLPLLTKEGLVFLAIDFVEVSRLRFLMDSVFGTDNFLADIAWEKRYTRSNNAKKFYSLKDTILCYRASPSLEVLRERRTESSMKHYTNPDNDPRGPWISSSYVNPATKSQRPNLAYAIVNSVTGVLVEHPTHAWKYDRNTHQRHVAENRLYWGTDGGNEFPRLKSFLSDASDGMIPVDVWHHKTTGTTDDGGNALKALFGFSAFDNPKPPSLVERSTALSPGTPKSLTILDHFAGSGTTGHAVINLNREDGGRRKFILVEMGDHFDTVLIPRMKKVAFSPEWKDGKPKRLATPEEAERSPRVMKVVRLESYEDALNNLETRRTRAQQGVLDGVEARGRRTA